MKLKELFDIGGKPESKKSEKLSLKESISPAVMDKILMPYKQPAKGSISGDVEDYVNVLEFAVEYLSNKSSASSKDFERFMSWVGKLTKKGSIEPAETIAGKTAQVKQEKDAAQNKQQSTKKPEPIDDEPTKKDPPKASSAPTPTAPTSGVSTPDKEDDVPLNVKYPAPEADLDAPFNQKKGGMPSLKNLFKKKDQEVDSDKDPSAGKVYRNRNGTEIGKRQDWSIGSKVNVGFHKGLTVKSKRAGGAYELEKNGIRYLFQPWSGGITRIK